MSPRKGEERGGVNIWKGRASKGQMAVVAPPARPPASPAFFSGGEKDRIHV